MQQLPDFLLLYGRDNKNINLDRTAATNHDKPNNEPKLLAPTKLPKWVDLTSRLVDANENEVHLHLTPQVYMSSWH